MSVDLNKAIVSRFYEELWNARNLTVADEVFSADCVTHQLQSGVSATAVPRNPEAVKHHVAEWLASFPDLHFDVEHMLAEADHVVSRSVMKGTHKGAWNGIEPTGKQVSIRMIVDHRIANGKIVEDWVLVEALGYFQQLGIVSTTAELFAANPETS